jgi:hypothetical protein
VKNFPGLQFQAQQASVSLLMKPSLLCHAWSRKLLEKLMDMQDNIGRNRNGSQSHFKRGD